MPLQFDIVYCTVGAIPVWSPFRLMIIMVMGTRTGCPYIPDNWWAVPTLHF